MAVTADASYDAVIISGPRRGEIIRLPANERDEVPEEDLNLLNQALDHLIQAVERYSDEIRATTQAVRAG